MSCVIHMICKLMCTENEREFDYSEGGERGPSKWGDMKEEWAACKNGNMQSPIDMSSHTSPDLRTFYKPASALIRNRGHDISVR